MYLFTRPSSTVYVCLGVQISPLDKGTRYIGWEPHPVISFNLVTSIMVLYPNITNLGVKASTQQFGGHNAVYNNNPFSSAWPGTRKYYSICWLQNNQGCEWNELVHWKIFHLSESVFLLGKQESWYIYIHKYVYMYIYAVRMGVLEMFARWVGCAARLHRLFPPKASYR